jgi:hypothetical protein
VTCQSPVQTVQRGASNAHFGVTASMLSIPPASEGVARLMERFWPTLKHVPEPALPPTLEGLLQDQFVDIATALEWIKRRRRVEMDPEGESEASCRHQEFRSLGLACHAAPDQALRPDFENDPFLLPGSLSRWFDLASATRRLREVRALCGFTRIRDATVTAEAISGELARGAIAPLAAQPFTWLPAVEVRGEGIFLRFAEERVADWASSARGVAERAAQIQAILAAQSAHEGTAIPFTITPRLLLAHSFAHVMLRRLSLDCGYSSASLRERLYVSEPDHAVPAMAGILIYTASPDSDGSLGGLISLATAEHLEDVIRRAVEDLRWCGSDPVCIETPPAVLGERHSGAACHGCLLVPETACERFNRELDRAILVGTPDGSISGFFADFLTPRA